VPPHPRTSYRDLPHRKRRRLLLVSLLRSLLVSTALVTLYFVLPMTAGIDTYTALELVGGLVLIGAVLTWQTLTISRSPYPRLRAIESLATTLPLFLLLFATTSYLVDRNVPGSYSQPMTRLDSLYFTVTVFTTVGFGDITAVSQTARGVMIVQMLADLALVGLVARVLFGAVQVGLQRQAGANDPAATTPEPGAAPGVAEAPPPGTAPATHHDD
jgi:voltage-gated potassium channel